MRKIFAQELYKYMSKNKDIYLVVGDLGYGIWDKIRDDFPERAYNCGAAEQTAVDICIGLALEGKIPIWYSITTFALYRPFESLRTYINHESIPVKIIASGRDKDYTHDGWSHDASDVKPFLDQFKNIKQLWPNDVNEIPKMVDKMINDPVSYFISLRR